MLLILVKLERLASLSVFSAFCVFLFLPSHICFSCLVFLSFLLRRIFPGICPVFSEIGVCGLFLFHIFPRVLADLLGYILF